MFLSLLTAATVLVFDPIPISTLPDGFPGIEFTVHGTQTEGLYLFAPILFNGSTQESYLILLNNNGEPVMYLREPAGIFCVEVQSDGYLSYGVHVGGGQRRFFEIGHDLAVTDSFQVVGYPTDIHDFTVLEDSTVLLIGVITEIVDMSQLVPGGDPQAEVKGCILQIQDRDHVPIFQWNSFDHIDILDAASWVDLTAGYIDYMHVNSADVDTDGNLLISALGLCACLKIDRTTGEVLWRLGGTHAAESDFTIIGDALGGFNGQHDFKGYAGDIYTLFDNGAHHSTAQSRAMVYHLDPDSGTATAVWSHALGFYGSHAGSVERFADGTVIVGWGTVNGPVDDFHEVSSSGDIVASCHYLPGPLDSYRVYKSDWTFQGTAPYLVAETPADHVLLTYHVFGEDEFVEYRIFTGPSPAELQHIWTTTDNQSVLWNLPTGMNYFGVTAVDAFSMETGMSNIDSAMVTWTDIEVGEPSPVRVLDLSPSPFSSSLRIAYKIPESMWMSLSVYDITGRLVAELEDGVMDAGTHTVTWNTDELPPGCYTVMLVTAGGRSSRNCVLVR